MIIYTHLFLPMAKQGVAITLTTLDNTKMLGFDLKKVLRWRIYECIAQGEDISPYVKEEGRVADTYKVQTKV